MTSLGEFAFACLNFWQESAAREQSDRKRSDRLTKRYGALLRLSKCLTSAQPEDRVTSITAELRPVPAAVSVQSPLQILCFDLSVVRQRVIRCLVYATTEKALIRRCSRVRAVWRSRNVRTRFMVRRCSPFWVEAHQDSNSEELIPTPLRGYSLISKESLWRPDIVGTGLVLGFRQEGIGSTMRDKNERIESSTKIVRN